MKKIIYLLAVVFSQIVNAQPNYLDLINKYEKLDWYSTSFFDNVSVDRHIEYMIVDSLLTNIGAKQVIVKYRPSGLHLRRRSYWTKTYTSSGIHYKNTKYNSLPDTLATKQFDSHGRVVSIQREHFTETYQYDTNNNLIEIRKLFNPYNMDSSAFQTLCFYSANKWIGKYDNNHKLIHEETYWDNGKSFKSDYKYSNRILTSANYNAIKQEHLIKEYIYENGLLIKILIYNSKGHKIRTIKYKWITKNET